MITIKHTFKTFLITALALAAAAQSAMAEWPPIGRMPGQYTIRTKLTTFVTARPGKHERDAVITSSINAGPNERFVFYRMAPNYTLIKATNGFYLSATAGGGLGAGYYAGDILNANRTEIAEDALFKLSSPAPGYQPYTIQTFYKFYLTALNGGGKTVAAFHSNATRALAWEQFQINQCGDLGSGYHYAIVPKATAQPLSASAGRVKNGISTTDSSPRGARFRLMRQPTGYHALQLFDGTHYVTAANGGGLSGPTATTDTLVTHQTQVQAWEAFAFMDQGNCTYTIQTSKGSYIGINRTRNISTAIPNPRTGANLGYNVYFELVPFVSQ